MKPATARRLRLLATGLAGMIVLALVAEFAIGTWIMGPSTTAYDAEVGLVHRPGARFVNSLEGWSATRVNAYGRFDDGPREPRAAHFALLLGDSYAEALQLDREAGFAQIAERSLPGLEVFNVAQSGRAPADYVRFASAYVPRFRPDLVIVQLNDGDIPELVNPQPGDAVEAALLAGDANAASRVTGVHASPMQRLRRLLGRSALLKYATARSQMLLGKERTRLGRKFGRGVPADPDAAGMDAIPAGADSAADAALSALATECPGLLLLYIPAVDYFADPPRAERPARGAFWREAAERNGIELIDPTAAILAEYARTREPLHGFQNSVIGSGHINRRGHRLVGEMLAKAIGRRVGGG